MTAEMEEGEEYSEEGRGDNANDETMGLHRRKKMYRARLKLCSIGTQ